MPKELKRWSLLVLLLAAAAASDLRPARGDDERPGETDPVKNPVRHTLFADDEVLIPAALQTVEITLAPQDASLRHWGAGERLGKQCGYAARRVARGRITTPAADQVVCVTPYTVSLLGDHPRSQELPDAGLLFARSVAVAVGDLVPSADADDVRHDEIVVAYSRRDQHVGLLVLDHELRTVAAAVTPRPLRGDVAVALGNFGGDGTLEILLATGDANPADYNPSEYGKYPGSLNLETYRLESDGGTPRLALKAQRVEKIDAAFYSVSLTAADYDGDGRDDALLAYYPLKNAGNEVQLALYRAGADLAFERMATRTLEAPAVTSYVAVASGLLRFLPAAGYSLDRRQFAVTFADPSGRVVVSAFDVTGELTRIEPKGRVVLEHPTVPQLRGPGIAVGNFVGRRDVNSPRMQIALDVPRPGANGANYPRFVVLDVDEQMNLSERAALEWPQYAEAGTLWTQELAAYDADGDAYYLGAPVHLTLFDVVQPEYVIEQPPKHVDYLPLDPKNPCEGRDVLNVSAYASFTVTLSDSADHVLESTLTDTTAWNIGGSVATSAFATVWGGFGDIGRAGVSTGNTIALGYDYDANTSQLNTLYSSRRIQESEETTIDDLVRASVRLIDVWRYPVLGLHLEESPLNGFYELTLPGPNIEVSGGGMNQDWYQPRHVRNNMLSYPSAKLPPPPQTGCDAPWRPDAAYFPADVGCFQPQGRPPIRAVMNEPKLLYWDANRGSFELTWSSQAGKETIKSYTSTLRESLDLRFGVDASAWALVAGGSVERSFDFNFQNTNSWSNTAVSREQISATRGITLIKPDEGNGKQGYGFKTAIYATEQGNLKVAHAVDPLASALGAAWWKSYYAGHPDPALNLPNRFTYDVGTWILSGEEDGQRMRGGWLSKSQPNPVTGSYDVIGSALTAGDVVEVWATVYNFSLDTKTGPLVARFEYAQVDPATDKIIGPVTLIGDTTTGVEPLFNRDVHVRWDTRGLDPPVPGGSNYYRLLVTLDPDDAVKDEIHELRNRCGRGVADPGGNNRGFFPWTGGVAIHGPRPAAAVEDVSAGADSLALETEAGHLETKAAQVRAGRRYRLRAVFRSQSAQEGRRVAVFYEGGEPRRVIAMKSVPGLGAGDNYVWAEWTPSGSLPASIAVHLLERPDDATPGNASDTLDLAVVDPSRR